MLPEQQEKSATASLNSSQLTQLQQTIVNYSPLQLAWASGYLAAKSEQPMLAGNVQPNIEAQVASKLTILYASQTGNAKGVAKKLAELAKTQGCAVNLQNIADYKAKNLKNERYLVIVASTNGEGEPPDDALAFHEFLLSKKAPKLPNLHYSVLALGDSSYEFFCQTGKDFDERLKALGAKAIIARKDCDVDYELDANTWNEQLVDEVKVALAASSQVAEVVAFPQAEASHTLYSKENPYEAELLVSQKITGRDSNKTVVHVEIDLGDSAINYQAGDALGVYFNNDENLVDELLQCLGFKGDEKVQLAEHEYSLKTALQTQLEITQTSISFVEFWAQHSKEVSLQTLLNDKNSLRDFANTHQLIDVIEKAPKPIAAQVFVEQLRKITPRLYSIASSQNEVEDEVHLTVGLLEYQYNGNTRYGAASSFLAKRLAEGEKVKIFVEENNNFRLPENTTKGNKTPIIMIGAGTGIAPFRAFMQEREARAEQGFELGKSWLFFGEQTFTQDFLYQVEWQNYLKSGLLTHMDVAFSRDQAEKIYVQHRLKAKAKEIYQWLEQGAHLYLCGDANRMAKDVHQTLVDIICEQGGNSREQAEGYLKTLRSEKRYQKDVY